MNNDIFIGVTSWNSELFLDCCLTAIKNTTKGINRHVVVLDNCSTDRSCEIAESHGVQIVIKKMSQPAALNFLLDMSNSQYTLLVHADTIMLSSRWFELCSNRINNNNILVSPEDIGCGPMTRSFGKNMPESSFLFFDTREAKKLRKYRVTKRRFRIPLKIERLLNFYGEHVTHSLPSELYSRGKTWSPMKVLHSNVLTEELYTPRHKSKNWTELLGKLEYGLGNFYAIDGEITHYHNWYDRISSKAYDANNPTTQKNNDGFEVDYVHQYSMRFINDFCNGSVNIPKI